jgi:molybdopterin converting factor subunit 1
VLVTIRLFARLREIVGASELERTLPAPATARTAWETIAREFPGIAEYEATISCAVNEEYARLSAPLADGDDVAFLPPVSGGSQEHGVPNRRRGVQEFFL